MTTTTDRDVALDSCLWDAIKRDVSRLSGFRRGDATTTTTTERCRLYPDEVSAIVIRMQSAGYQNVDPTVVKKRFVEARNERDILDVLLSVGRGIEQRTPEWYRARHQFVTASDIAQALGHSKFGTEREFYAKKVPPMVEIGSAEASAKANFYSTLAPLKWGTMFEDVAAKLYERRQGLDLYEFGLLPHPDPTVKVGASPDGINELGVMVEIKCPYRRKINGEVPLQYYYQIQGQLEVCGLKRCDYLECEFSEYSDEEEFLEDLLEIEDEDEDEDVVLVASTGFEKGVIAEYSKTDETTGEISMTYAYGKPCPTRKEHREWMEQHRTSAQKLHFWRLEKYGVIRVNKDDELVRSMLTDLDGVWKRVEEFRADYTKFVRWCASPDASATNTRKPAPKISIASVSTSETTAATTGLQNMSLGPTTSKRKKQQQPAFKSYAFVEENDV